MIWIIYLVTITYCLFKMIKSYKKNFENSPIGPMPGLDTLVVILFAPLLAAVDISLTWIRLIRESHKDSNRFI